MLRKAVSGIMLTPLLICILTLAFNVQPVKGSGTIYIRGDGSVEPPDAPISSVDNVTYTFTGNINDSIVVERNNVIIDGNWYTVQGNGTGCGFSLNSISNVTIKNTNIENFDYGVVLSWSSNSSIYRNNIIAGKYDSGISLSRSTNNNISRNNITNSYYGIILSESSNNTFRNNSLANNTHNLAVDIHFINDVDASNTVDGKPVYYWVNRQNMTVPLDAGYVVLANCTGITAQNLNLTKNGEGVLLAFTTNSTIAKNNIANRGVGIYLYYSLNNTICENSISGNVTYRSYGINILCSSNNTVFGNNITANQWNGIYLGSSNNNSIVGNNITANWDQGIILDGSSNNSISGNNIANNYFGIELEDSSNNTLAGNNIVNNRNFLELGYGIELWGSSDNIIIVNNITHNDYGIRLDQSSNNKIYHNNLIGNGQQVDIKTPGYSNSWDDGYPSGGNYWSDYDGVDLYSGRYQNETGGDGIGDKPYIVDADNQDRYPLITHWPPSEHELVTSITGPAFLWLGGSIPLEAIVMNEGVNDEANVELALLINGVIVNSTTIPLLQASDSYTLSYLWTPSVGGTYNITAYASSVPEEESVENNKVTKFVTVGVRPPPPRVGAKAGDWIKYDYTVTGAPSGQALPTWARVEFLSVEGANATMRVTIRWSDGTEQNETMTVDITIGGGPIGTFKGFLIPANCTTGVSIYMSGYGNVTIKGETIRTCAGASRTLVYTSFEQYGTQLTYHWDKQTGVMVEASATVGGMTATAKVAETNMWQPTPFWMQWWLWTIVAVIIVALAGALYLLKKRKPPTPTAPTLPTEGI